MPTRARVALPPLLQQNPLHLNKQKQRPSMILRRRQLLRVRGSQSLNPKHRQLQHLLLQDRRKRLRSCGPPMLRGPQTPYETKPHMKQHCCCTWQGHPGLASSTVVAAENRPKDDVVSCRVCFVSGDIVGGICGPQYNEGPRSRCFTLGL